eukprot:TRINITY_DN23896_c0_g1_i1.p2 TRINITY_DN23896_c0_g1~~TRINITY_DN23896_c0_g1_i1.p2  ORF type:complete len:206 (-),score=42.01 TRINITY_DN23896_c0_g1_i1:128-745(-)
MATAVAAVAPLSRFAGWRFITPSLAAVPQACAASAMAGTPWHLFFCAGFQARTKVVVNMNAVTKKASRSSGPGGQSVNMSDTRVQLSFKLDKADWIPEPVRAKMKVLHKNRINKAGEFSVACQVSSSTIENTKLAKEMIEKFIAEAETAVIDAEREANKMDPRLWNIEKMKRDGREKELEKKAEAVKRQKSESRERTRNKKISMY